MSKLVYNGVFIKNGKELFRSQMIAGYTMVITAIKMGGNGYAIERNTRYSDHFGGNKEMFNGLESGKQLNGWVLRKILETQNTFEDAVKSIKNSPYVCTEYNIISGVKKGLIIARNPKNVAHIQDIT